MPTDKERGPHSKTVESGKKMGNTKFSSAPQPSFNLKSNPNSDVERAFKKLKFTTPMQSSADMESMFKKAKFTS